MDRAGKTKATAAKEKALGGRSSEPREAKQPYASEAEDYVHGQPENLEKHKTDAAENAGKGKH